MANPWTAEAWNVTDQVRIIKTKGLPVAMQMAADAGTTINGGPPPKPGVRQEIVQVFHRAPGTTAFTKLTDAPKTYVGQNGKLVAVKPTEDGLLFVDASGGGGMINQAPASDVTLPANYALIAMVEYTIASGVSLTFGQNAMMRII